MNIQPPVHTSSRTQIHSTGHFWCGVRAPFLKYNHTASQAHDRHFRVAKYALSSPQVPQPQRLLATQQYVIQLASVRKEALEQANTRLVVIGCGDWKLIKNYCGEQNSEVGSPAAQLLNLPRYPLATWTNDRTGLTDFKGGMYADPSRKLYHTFGLIETLDRTPAGQEKRSYLGKSVISNILASIWVRTYRA